MSRLNSESSRDELVAYLEAKHPLLVALLPGDVANDDVFSQVEHKKELARCFEPSEDGQVLRELDRLTKEIEVQLAEEAATKKKQGKAKRHAEQVAKHKKKAKKWTQSVEPPPPPTMSLNESAATMLLAEEQKEEARREALLKKGWTGKFPRGCRGGTAAGELPPAVAAAVAAFAEF